ncbi:MAG: hypothetical protein AB1641_15385 [Thermodesulfobacteriota bacterium]
MEPLLMRLGLLVLGFSTLLSPLFFLLVFLKNRDRRETGLREIVFKELNSPALRGLYAARIECSWWSGRTLVALDFHDCLNTLIWDAVMRLSLKLPRQVELMVDGLLYPRSRSRFRIRVNRSDHFGDALPLDQGTGPTPWPWIDSCLPGGAGAKCGAV